MRTARALFYLYMLKRGYWLMEYIERKGKEDDLLRARLSEEHELNYRQRAVLGRALRDDLLDLVDRGYLSQRRHGRRTYVFSPAPDLRARLDR